MLVEGVVTQIMGGRLDNPFGYRLADYALLQGRCEKLRKKGQDLEYHYAGKQASPLVREKPLHETDRNLPFFGLDADDHALYGRDEHFAKRP